MKRKGKHWIEKNETTLLFERFQKEYKEAPKFSDNFFRGIFLVEITNEVVVDRDLDILGEGVTLKEAKINALKMLLKY